MSGRTQQVVEAIRARIGGKSLAPGEKLPSVRRLAREMAASPSTVVDAYDRLVNEGLVHARPGSGFYVSAARTPPPLAVAEPRRDRAIDPLWVSRQALDAGAGAFTPGCGWLPADWMPLDSLRRALRHAARGPDAAIAEYGGTQGPLALRALLARRLAGQGLDVGPDRVLLTASGTEAIDLVCRSLLNPGDTVLLDDPCYFNFQALLRAHRATIVSVPYTPAGPDPVAFAAAVEAHRPRLYITNSALHNPTGATLSPQVAHKLLLAAAGCGMTIVEDDIFSEFEPEPSPRLAALDGLASVIRIGSFSKTVSASLRCGYIAASAEHIDALVDLQVATRFGGPSPVTAHALLAVLGDGAYRRHLDQLRRRLATARVEAAERLSSVGITPWIMPRGGFYLWCRLPAGCDAAALARSALADGVVLAPGNVFSPTESAPDFMRFNVAHLEDPRVLATLARHIAAAPRDAGIVASASVSAR
ncbi:PLP-dependent aminotransferase family protein [uncultured Alsobacter sp.]|uniref:aminotransferase-like domain-containing protein n=1 Tax=uncultured Alsobacter sp. TaxID=1748258 RepID=UPI0025E21059|nr:PLP-dependent aminotransferase family protein [uncultured Alsobacter sp.]